ncbi:MAG: hypothetical protein ACOYVD_08595 [Bacillota bacterium]
MVMAYKKVVGTDYVPENYSDSKKNANKVPTSKKSWWLFKATPAMVLIVLIFITGMAFVAQHVWINFLGYQIAQLNKNINNIQVNNEKLKLKIASFGSLEKIEESALKMGMVYPQNQSIHYIFSQNNHRNNETSIVQITGLVAPDNNTMSSQTGNIAAQQAWLGTVQDFFYHWLLGKSKN